MRQLKSLDEALETDLLKKEGFRDGVSDVRLVLSQRNSGGPIPNEEATSTEQECWWMYVKPVFEALLAQTNEEFIAENVRIHEKKLNSSILEITMEELLNYWCICLSFGLNRQPSKTVYWANPDNSDGILGNDFVQSTMGRRKFGLINRFLSIDCT
eukprot:TRINITY_DN4854_c0_g1_i1.p1 TRINITY_DN4854_c0_g1~~TRINITY_DN4854_c0_g1_i1.p1  ORF type:complete len:156 (-),score=13.04 TRINITY_DN4854_c0_g1_i1:127-594(-)